ncbi:hypothetical protein IFJ75_02490 [Brevundimonas goettingensis]|uniref:DUF4062 domain-containing protein n=2 Tax=Brevundimonas goettingensis TaxID=2774190 RepID=A0A975C3H1_9CAUL|nr:hypothetical protein IFJ75_02490 [Brevundimonas goettingensis]
MAYKANVVSVMIASPSDVPTERALVRQILTEWNDVYSKREALVLMPVGWETHSSPELSGRPQDMINERLLADADLLIGIFWTRVGSDTGKAISGSIEEIDRHRKAGKPVMIYFSEAPVRPDSVDREQYEKLKEFKSWAMTEGLVQTYQSLDDFRMKLQRQVPLALQQNPYLQSVIGAAEGGYVTVNLDPDMGSFRSAEPSLSEAAAALLRSAVQDGTIMVLRTLGGTHVQAGRETFGDNSPRDTARWTGAVEELVKRGFLSDRGHKGQLFAVTNAGFEYAEEIGYPIGTTL